MPFPIAGQILGILGIKVKHNVVISPALANEPSCQWCPSKRGYKGRISCTRYAFEALPGLVA